MKLYIPESNMNLMKDISNNPHTAKEKGLTKIIKSNKLRLVLSNKKIIYDPKVIDKILFEEDDDERSDDPEEDSNIKSGGSNPKSGSSNIKSGGSNPKSGDRLRSKNRPDNKSRSDNYVNPRDDGDTLEKDDEEISNLNLPKSLPEKKKINISDEECLKLLYN